MRLGSADVLVRALARIESTAFSWCCGLLLVPGIIAASPDIDSIIPRGIQPGVPTEITLSGNDLAGAQKLWTSFPARVERLSEARFRITTGAAVGPGVLRVYGSNGVSNPVFVFVDDLPTVIGARTNHTRAAAQPVVFGSAVEGVCPELNYAWFKLRLNRGQRLALEIVASRLGSRLDSVLRVVNAAGREVAQNDDAPGLAGESHASLVAAEAGDYFVELRDVNYGGGPSFFYRLRIGDFPLITSAFPARAGQGIATTFQLAGPGGVMGRVKAGAPTNAASIRLALKGRAGSAFASAISSRSTELIEKETDDSQANPCSLGDGLNGRFDKAKDRDVYAFAAEQERPVEFRAATRSLGAACDAVLTLESADGRRLIRSNPSASDEGVLAYSFPSNGMYRLSIEEASGAFGPHLVYHIAARPAGLGLSMETETLNAAPGNSFELKVAASRAEFKGAITLAVEGPGGPLVVTNNVIAEGKSNVTVRVSVPESFAAGTFQELTVRGTARRDGKILQARASTTPAWRRHLPLMLHPPPDLDGVVLLGVAQPR